MSSKTSVAGYVFVLVLGLIVCGKVYAQEDLAPRTIDVSGTAELELMPDMIIWRISLIDNHTDTMTAKRFNDERLEGVLEIASDMDLPERDVQAGTISIHRVYERDERVGNTSRFKHYSFRREVIIILRDFEAFDEMMEKLVAIQVEFAVSYDSSQRIETRAQARLSAVQAARDKAEAMSQVLGQEIGRPLSIEEHRGNLMWSNPLSNTNSEGTAPEATRRMAPGAIKVTSTVYIVFELADE